MKRIFRLSYELFMNGFPLNFLVSLQLCALLIFGNMVIALSNSSRECYDLTKTENEQNIYAYSPSSADVYDSDSSAINRYSDVIEQSRCKNYDIGLDDDSGALVIGYGSCISDLMKSQLIAGVWFDEAQTEPGVINCVISGNEDNYPIGSYIPAHGYAGYTIVDGNPIFDMRQLTFKVCGYIRDNPSVMTMTATSDDMTVDLLFKKYNTSGNSFFDKLYNSNNDRYHSSEGQDCIIICGDDPDEITEYGSSNSIIVLADHLSESEKTQILSELSHEAAIFSLTEMRERSRQASDDELMLFLPMLICFVSMGLLGIVCVSLMAMMKNQSVFKIYINCGMSKKDGLLLILFFMLILLMLTLLLFSTVWLILLSMKILPWDSMLVLGNNYWYTGACISAIIIGMIGIQTAILNTYYKQEK